MTDRLHDDLVGFLVEYPTEGHAAYTASLAAEVRESRAAIARVHAVLTTWDSTFPEEGWGVLLQDIVDALYPGGPPAP